MHIIKEKKKKVNDVWMLSNTPCTNDTLWQSFLRVNEDVSASHLGQVKIVQFLLMAMLFLTS